MPHKIKILHLISKIDLSQGGPPRMVLKTFQAQRKLGYQSKILTTSKYLIKKNKFIYKGTLFNKRFAIPNLSLVIKIFNEIKKNDVIHIHNFWNVFVTISIIFSRYHKKKIILSPHGSMHKDNLKKNYLLKWIYYYLIEKKNLDQVHKFHFLNKRENINFSYKNYLKKNNSIIIPNSVDIINRKYKNIKKIITNKYNFSYIGRIAKNKGIEIMIESYLMFKKKNFDISLHIIGPNSTYKKFLQNKYNNVVLKKNIYFHKPIYSNIRFNIMNISTALFLLSDLECDSILAKEVWASKGLLITTKMSYNEDYYQKKIALIVNQNINSILKAMTKTIDDRKKMDIIKENGYKYSLLSLNIIKNTKKLTTSY
jgi:glycosyltransferase involved in cell wall biosynthesis